MVVIFEFTMGGERVEAVHWEEKGCMVGKVLAPDGTIKDERREHCPHLSDLAREVAGGQGQVYAAEVDDVRSALKYLGKSADLAQMLPRVDVHVDAPPRELANYDDPSANIFKPDTL